MDKSSKIYVAGHRGLAGSAILRHLQSTGFNNLLTRNHSELDLCNQQAVADFFRIEKPAYVILAAARVGGIHANRSYPAEFIHQNLQIQTNVIHQSYLHGVKRLVFLGSSCIYPKLAAQPMKERDLMNGPLESTNEAYAVAKIAGIYMCWAYNKQYGTQFIPLMPTNLYGFNDNFDLENAHVLPAMMRKFHLAKLASKGAWDDIRKDERRFGPIPSKIMQDLGMPSPDNSSDQKATSVVTLWGSGSSCREFLFSDDLASACCFLMEKNWKQLKAGVPGDEQMLFNVGVGLDMPIKSLAGLMADVTSCKGNVDWDRSMPDGTPRKLMDVDRMARLGWRASTALEQGLRKTYRWYQKQTAGQVV
ncbi:MAG: GDP-L-fucose synthase [Desulfobacteraceae bacterium]|nr:GDP-L-fucose synthase [Desulfobacteraceae bacterium]